MMSSITLIHSITIIASTWMSPNSTLFHKDTSMAVGYYNETIFIIGGIWNPYNATEFRIDTASFFSFENNNYITGDGFDPARDDLSGQYWTQQHDILYLIEPIGDPSRFAVFNMKNKQYTSFWMNITITPSVEFRSCLASSKHYLFVTGGWSTTGYHSELQMLTLSTHEWIQNMPQMNQERGLHACAVNDDTLFVFGGYVDKKPNYLDSIEYINIANITQTSWTITDAILTRAVCGLRAVSSAQDIYIIGGSTGYRSEYLNIVHVFDTISYTITVSEDVLSYPVAYASVILVESVIYVFGGHVEQTHPWATDKWMFYSLSTMNSTLTQMSSSVPSYNLSSVASFSTEASTLLPAFDQNQELYTTESDRSTQRNTSTLKDALASTQSSYLMNSTVSGRVSKTTADTDNIQNTKNVEKNKERTWVTVAIACFICLLLIMSIVLIRSFRFRDHQKDEDMVKNELKMNSTINKQNVVISGDDNEGKTKRVQLVDLLHDTAGLENIIERRSNNNALQVQHWLENEVKSPQCFDIFMNNGYESMQIIKEISGVKELNEIGIESKQVQMKILEEIKKWKSAHEENRKREGSLWNDRALQRQQKLTHDDENTNDKNIETNKAQ